jgi:DMSO/TMAO reductase YedYZ molybdopterin-dependent catalytic subunit
MLALVGFLAQGQELRVEGAVKSPMSWTAEDLAKLPRASVETRNDGIAARYEGVWLHDLLKRAGAPSGAELRGKALASYLIASASDGYQVVYSLAEVDPVFTDNQVLVADSLDGKPLMGAQGRFRLVAPKDKRGARSVRMLAKIEVVVLRP